MKIIKATALALAVMLSVSAAVSLGGCAVKVQAADLMDGVEPGTAESRETDAEFSAAYADFSAKLFAKCAESDENTLVSPLSVMRALAMTANGAAGETKAQMEAVLGGIDTDRLSEYLYTYSKELTEGRNDELRVDDSIWIRDDGSLDVKKEFLQKNADFFAASAYKAPFDRQTVLDINKWVSEKTDGMIDSIIEKIRRDEVMLILDTLSFNAEWMLPYKNEDCFDGEFTSSRDKKQPVSYMRSAEGKYIKDDNATGFIKNYKGGKYAFAAILPDEGIGIEEYAAALTGERLTSMINNSTAKSVEAVMPKFSYEYGTKMNDALIELGMTDAFGNKADFSLIGGENRELFIGEVVHKTYITVDNLGTKAGAVTNVGIAMGMSDPNDICKVELTRPFVYAIIDCESGLPVFLGAVTSIK